MNKKKKRGFIEIIGGIFLIIIVLLFIIRAVSPREIDDVNPNIECPEIGKYNPDILWVIPSYENDSISEEGYKEWCNSINLLNKTIGMHGVTHEYREFQNTLSKEYLERGLNDFEGCFGYYPEKFKPPQLRINSENKELLKEYNLKLRNKINQVFHKVYHCSDTGKIPNWVIDNF